MVTWARPTVSSPALLAGPTAAFYHAHVHGRAWMLSAPQKNTSYQSCVKDKKNPINRHMS